MERFIAQNPNYSVAGYVDANGIIQCANDGVGRDISESPVWQAFMANPARTVAANPMGLVSEEWVIIVREPVMIDGELAGAVSVSIPHRLLSALGNDSVVTDADRAPLQLVTFNSRGEILSRMVGDDRFDDRDLPPGDLAEIARDGARAYTATSRDGLLRTYAVTPIVPGSVYAMGIWQPDLPGHQALPTWFAIMLFPLLMWAASLFVAAIAMHRLVLVHVETLRRKMRSFGRTRRLPETLAAKGTPAEFREMDAEFMAMAEAVMRDEAQLEDAVREKNILLKEIHHRVKNNLQLLSSITSMKRRKAQTPEARVMLQRLQDRILSLAAIHRNLYLAKDMSSVDAPRLVQDVSAQFGFLPGQERLKLHVDPVTLLPQQAVPLSLFVAESFAMADQSAGCSVDLHMTSGQGREVELSFTFTARDISDDVGDVAISHNLVAAFADQLGGTITDTTLDDGQRRIVLRFAVVDAVQEAMDY